MFNILHRLNKKGTTIVTAEQRLELIAEYADRVIVLKNGEMVLDGTPQEILTSPALNQVRAKHEIKLYARSLTYPVKNHWI